jgi:signal transduction histidine kinase
MSTHSPDDATDYAANELEKRLRLAKNQIEAAQECYPTLATHLNGAADGIDGFLEALAQKEQQAHQAFNDHLKEKRK